ncbi:MAG: CDP-alcohol phosphatidyltransferase family protein [Melioribacteraceae bacterium]
MRIQFKQINTISNYVSFSRVLLAIPIYFYISQINEIANARNILIALYITAYITDLLDGYLARKLNQISELGKIIDPLADKILVIMIVSYLYIFNIIPPIYFWIIILRDLIIFVGGIFVSKKIGKVLPSDYLGKATVLTIGFFVIAVTANLNSGSILYQALYYGSLLLSFASVINYGLRGMKEIKRETNGDI